MGSKAFRFRNMIASIQYTVQSLQIMVVSYQYIAQCNSSAAIQYCHLNCIHLSFVVVVIVDLLAIELPNIICIFKMLRVSFPCVSLFLPLHYIALQFALCSPFYHFTFWLCVLRLKPLSTFSLPTNTQLSRHSQSHNCKLFALSTQGLILYFGIRWKTCGIIHIYAAAIAL